MPGGGRRTALVTGALLVGGGAGAVVRRRPRVDAVTETRAGAVAPVIIALTGAAASPRLAEGERGNHGAGETAAEPPQRLAPRQPPGQGLRQLIEIELVVHLTLLSAAPVGCPSSPLPLTFS
jgi:hypothetical protein